MFVFDRKWDTRPRGPKPSPFSVLSITQSALKAILFPQTCLGRKLWVGGMRIVQHSEFTYASLVTVKINPSLTTTTTTHTSPALPMIGTGMHAFEEMGLLPP